MRKVLGHGSGFDSPGFKELRRVAKPLGEQFHAARERAGLSLVEVYTQGREHEDLYSLAELCIEFDERVTVWRVRHFKVVRCTTLKCRTRQTVTRSSSSISSSARL